MLLTTRNFYFRRAMHQQMLIEDKLFLQGNVKNISIVYLNIMTYLMLTEVKMNAQCCGRYLLQYVLWFVLINILVTDVLVWKSLRLLFMAPVVFQPKRGLVNTRNVQVLKIFKSAERKWSMTAKNNGELSFITLTCSALLCRSQWMLPEPYPKCLFSNILKCRYLWYGYCTSGMKMISFGWNRGIVFSRVVVNNLIVCVAHFFKCCNISLWEYCLSSTMDWCWRLLGCESWIGPLLVKSCILSSWKCSICILWGNTD